MTIKTTRWVDQEGETRTLSYEWGTTGRVVVGTSNPKMDAPPISAAEILARRVFALEAELADHKRDAELSPVRWSGVAIVVQSRPNSHDKGLHYLASKPSEPSRIGMGPDPLSAVAYLINDALPAPPRDEDVRKLISDRLGVVYSLKAEPWEGITRELVRMFAPAAAVDRTDALRTLVQELDRHIRRAHVILRGAAHQGVDPALDEIRQRAGMEIGR